MTASRTSWRSRVAWPVVVAALAAGCAAGPTVRPEQVAEGNVAAGRTALEAYGCGSCHSIPGVRGADGMVGPPLNRFGARSYIAGRLANNHENLVRWVRDPQDVDPQTAMPDLSVTEQDAVNIATYLMSLD